MTDERPTLETPPPTTPSGPPDVAPEADALPPTGAVDDAPPDEPDEEKDEATPAEPSKKKWYVVKVQSGREESIRLAIENRVKREGLEEFFGQIVVPVEKVTEMVKGKRVVKERKLYPGYLMVEVEYNDRILYLFRETSGVGDFVGGGVNRAPPPMPQQEVERMLGIQNQLQPGIKASKPRFDRGDRVRVKDGTFAGMEGEVKEILEAKSLVKVELTIFGRGVPVELEYWQVELV